MSGHELNREQLLQFLSPAAPTPCSPPRRPARTAATRASVLSCDVSGFRGLVSVDETAAFEVLATILEGAAAAIYAESGTLMSFPGDGALAVFGAPIATTSTADRRSGPRLLSPGLCSRQRRSSSSAASCRRSGSTSRSSRASSSPA